jgi:16S rRNA (guanine527-N7)-methyltransferase
MNQLWTDIAARAELALSDAQQAALSRYLDLLIEANQVMNLTRITDRAQAELLHIADALTLLPSLPKSPIKLADLGSGGGVPGIPLAIARPDVNVLLVESTRKKASFLQKTVEQLELHNVTVSGERVEDVGRSSHRATFDIVSARAVALLPWLIEWAMPLLKRNGSLLAMKGERASGEIAISNAVCKRLSAGVPTIQAIDLPGTQNHVIVRVEKIGPTAEQYPRPATVTKGKHL